MDRVISSQWYQAKDIETILECSKSYAYRVLKSLRTEITKTKIPGTDRFYAAPPAGKIRKDYFCEKYMLDVTECDKIIAERSAS